jgi:hypothetical protein
MLELFNSINESEADENDRYQARKAKEEVRDKKRAEIHRTKSHALMTKAGWELKKNLVHRSEYKHPQHPGHTVTVHHYDSSEGEFKHTVDHHPTLAGHIGSL